MTKRIELAISHILRHGSARMGQETFERGRLPNSEEDRDFEEGGWHYLIQKSRAIMNVQFRRIACLSRGGSQACHYPYPTEEIKISHRLPSLTKLTRQKQIDRITHRGRGLWRFRKHPSGEHRGNEEL